MDYIICKDTSKFKHKYLSSGTTADCYLTPDKRVYKEYTKQMLEETYDNVVRLSDMEIDSFVLPQTLVFNEAPSHETIEGYLMRYSKGKDLKQLSYYVQMREFLKALSKLEDDIKELSRNKMEIYDLKSANVLYVENNNRFDVLDTDFYVHCPGLRTEDLVVCNTMELEYLLYTSFIRANQKLLKNPRLLKMFEELSNGKGSATVYISELVAEIEKETRKRIDTYGDFREGIPYILKAR